ncbi:MAG: hypothetical protein AAFU54_12085 [Chloroflexota bacterium]
MPYNISWHIQDRVMLIEISGNISVQEFEQLHRDSFEYVGQSSYKVHAIADVSDFSAAPANVRMLVSATNEEKDDRQGMTVLVAPNLPKIFGFLASVILQSLRLEYRICDTREEAIEILRRIDTDLFAMADPGQHTG